MQRFQSLGIDDSIFDLSHKNAIRLFEGLILWIHFWCRWICRKHCVKCTRIQFFWSIFSRIWIEYVEIWSISQYWVHIRENTGPKNFQYEQFSRSESNSDNYHNMVILYVANIYLMWYTVLQGRSLSPFCSFCGL